LKNYKDSDYAVNKFSEGIVYRFADKTVEFTLSDFLEAYPDMNEQDFIRLKEWSDNDYLEQVRVDDVQTRRVTSIHGLEETEHVAGQPLDDEYEKSQDMVNAGKAMTLLLEKGLLTKVQARRAKLYFYEGLSLRQIADREGVHFTSIGESITAVTDKLKKYFGEL
jgi:hypothetical protein